MEEKLPVWTIVGAILVVYALAVVVGLFAFDFGESEPDPVSFDETVTVGLTLEDELRLETDDPDVSLPRAQVFYSQYPYVVGYYGIERFVETHREDAHERQFGHATVVYVSTFDDGSVDLTEEGYPLLNDSTAEETTAGTGHAHGGTAADGDWYPAADASYVVESDARTPAGPTVLPFADEGEAAAFADEHGGDVVSWDALLERSFDVDDAETVRNRTETREADADERVAGAVDLLERDVGAVVGEDARTVQEAVDAAPADTAVVVPEGTYEEHVELTRPVTLLGEPGATLVGDGDDTVVQVNESESAVYGLSIRGVGNETPGAAATEGHAHDHDHGDGSGDGAWDEAIEDDYARGDAAIAVDDAEAVLVDSVRIETPASGVMLRDSPDAVVRNVTVDGNPDYVEAHMGVVAMRSPGVVEHSTFRRGLDGVYTHSADGIVVRNNTMTDNRMGIHLMHTSGALLANNEVIDPVTEGIFVMTGPERNALVGNEITDAPTGIDVGGTDTYVAGNVVTGGDLGIQLDTTGSVFEHNVVADNRFGVATRALLPTNRVTENDFVGNERHVAGSTGPERVWTHDGTGNYWEGAVGTAEDGVFDRPYTPTDAVDAALHRVDGTPTLGQAPGRDALAGVEGTLSGMRDGEITDTAPLCAPVDTAWFDDRQLRPTC